jgi:hypothetical protein
MHGCDGDDVERVRPPSFFPRIQAHLFKRHTAVGSHKVLLTRGPSLKSVLKRREKADVAHRTLESVLASSEALSKWESSGRSSRSCESHALICPGNDMLTGGSFVLYMIYFPPHLKYLSVDVDPDTAEPATYGSTQTQSAGHRLVHVNTAVRTDAWRASTLLAWVVVLHL